ncbi:MAG: hypothetical protein L6Q63_04125 [Giesbergeria sp.]|nr:hypothetical protein [Giesbergeria sp.]
MSLPAPWVEKIFAKLALAYGRDFLARWEGLEIADVKDDWARELAGFAQHPDAIAYALAHLPARAPTVIEFRAIARQAPAAPVPRLPAPAADRALVEAEFAKLAPVRSGVSSNGPADHRAWARRILARADAGERINRMPLLMARQALGLQA